MRNINLFVFLFCICVFLSSCSKDEIVFPEANVEVAKTYLSLDQLADNPVELSNESGTYVLKIVSEQKWKATSSEEWCSLSVSEGFKYVEVPITFSDNPWNIERTAQLNFTVTETGESFVLNVTQVAAETSIEIDKDTLSYSVGGGEQIVSLKTNANDWSIEIVDANNPTNSGIEWCKSDRTSGQGSADIKITVDGNPTQALREAKIIFTAEDKMVELLVSQLDKFETPVIELDESVSFNLKWNEIVGLSHYEVIVTDEGGREIANLQLPSKTTSYDLSSIDWGEYVGKIKIRLAATMSISGTDKTQESNELEAHNYFDISSGNGSVEMPYIISKPRHLMNVAHFLDRENVSFRQTCDIDFAGIGFTTLSNAMVDNEYKGEFKGVYDAGKGNVADNETKRTTDRYKISNLVIQAPDKMSCGLFAKIGSGGTVRNLCIENPLIEGLIKVGGIAGETAGNILNCEIISSSDNYRIYAKGDGSNAYVGGMSGFMLNGEVSYCMNRCTIKGEAASVGGIIGSTNITSNTPRIAYCSNFATVNTDIKSPIGGIVGNVGGTGQGIAMNIEYCYNQGDVSGNNANNQVGGIAGRVVIKTFVNACQNDGSVTANGSAGGIVGRLGGTEGEIKNCVNTGIITSTGGATNGNSNAAGILATIQGAGYTMQNCLNVGTVSAGQDIYFNGIFNRADKAANNIYMDRCYAIDEDNVRQTDVSDANIKDKQSSSYTNISEANAAIQSTFIGWDFDRVWELSNGRYPTVKGVLK